MRWGLFLEPLGRPRFLAGGAGSGSVTDTVTEGDMGASRERAGAASEQDTSSSGDPMHCK